MKRFFVLFTIMVLVLTAKTQSFNAVCESGQTLMFRVMKGSDNQVSVLAPSNEKPVGKVVIPSFVEYNGKLYEVVCIGMRAFEGCKEMTSLTIPKTITSIDPVAFDYCRNIAEIIVDPENPVFDSRDNCNAIINTAENELVYGCKNAFIPNTVVSIDWYAFRGSGLTTITIPESVINISNQAFYDCLITELVIPSTVGSIDYDPWDSEKVTASLTTTDLKLEAGKYYFMDEYDEDGFAYGVVVVPCGMKEVYEATDWNKYLPIREDCDN